MLLTSLRKCCVTIALMVSISSTFANSDLSKFQQSFDDADYKIVVKSLEAFNIINFTPEHFEIYVSSLSHIDLDDAEAAAELAISMFSDEPEMYLMHASIMGSQASESIFSALGYAKKALKSLEKATSLAPNEPKYKRGLMSFYLMAPSIAGGDTDKALELAEAIARLDTVQGIVAKSRYFSAVDDYHNAYEIINKGIAEFPGEISLHAQLADLFLREDKYTDAIGTFQQAVQIPISKPSREELSNNNTQIEYENSISTLYNSHYQIGRAALLGEVMYAQGIKHLQTYIELRETTDIRLSGLPSINWALLRQAELFLKSGNIAQAKKTFATITNPKESSQFEKTYKKLSRKIKKS